MKKSSRFLGLAVTAALLAGASTAAFAQDAQEEVNKQIAKLIGDAISSRVSARALDAAGQGQNLILPHPANYLLLRFRPASGLCRGALPVVALEGMIRACR